jgi:hypothetical protein
MATFRAPNDVKLRCTSSRRYWVVEYWTGRDGVNRAQVVKRTDNPDTARHVLHCGPRVGRAVYDNSARPVARWL